MTDRRYSITPARAYTDGRLEGRDLHVLGFLGMHTDKLGWCFLSQGTIATALRCGRATVQRSLDRLIEAGYVQKREFTGARPHACHAYRVIMDLDDPEIEPPANAGTDDDGEPRCPQAGTSLGGASPAGTGAQPRSGTSMPEVPTHAWAHNDQDSSSSSGSPRAREVACLLSPEAFTTADEIAKIAGHDPQFLPPKWMSDGPVARVQMMLDRGWPSQMMIEMARSVMQQKRDGPPKSIRYFEPAFAEAHARQSQPTPLPVVTVEKPKPQVIHAAAQAPNDWRRRRDNGHDALRQFGEALDRAEADQCGPTGGTAVQDGVAAGRG